MRPEKGTWPVIQESGPQVASIWPPVWVTVTKALRSDGTGPAHAALCCAQSTAIHVIGMLPASAGTTSTARVAVVLLDVAVMTVSPRATPVNTPRSSTRAIAVLDEVQLMLGALPGGGPPSTRTVALSGTAIPTTPALPGSGAIWTLTTPVGVAPLGALGGELLLQPACATAKLTTMPAKA